MKLFVPVSFIIISIILFITIVNPNYKEVSQLRTDISAYNMALDNSTSLQKTQDSLIEKYKGIKQENKDRLDHFLPNTINNIKFILEVEQLANLHNLQIKDIKFQVEQPETTETKKVGDTSTISSRAANVPYGTFPIQFSVDSDYKTFILFLKDLELNLRLVDVESVSFSVPTVNPSGKGTEVDPNVYSYTLKVQTYWLK